MKKLLIATLLSFTLLFSGLAGSIQTEAASFSTSAANIAQKYIGKPYKWGGTTPKGFDCSGLVGYSFKKAGKTLPRTAAAMYKTGKSVAKNKLQKGDLVFFNTSSKGVSHVAIYIGNNKVVHSVTKGVKIDSLSNSYWKARYVGAKRL
ncbi:C40 family peptidase [Mesobacillus harenae]|uniref:C40 family peptidase n=1 Tax=Mesobacillus harenae TaxID=2213203 RepID=UPI00157FD3FA|nr:C40 family peptidase [Mesobacillus harenae]